MVITAKHDTVATSVKLWLSCDWDSSTLSVYARSQACLRVQDSCAMKHLDVATESWIMECFVVKEK